MALTPLDIHHKEFKTARFGGYNEEEVDSFLDQIADELERIIQENVDLRQQMEHAKKRLSEFEEMQTSLQSALLAATKSAEAVKEQAKQEAEAVIRQAREGADAITLNARKEADSALTSAQEQARQVMLRAQAEKQKLDRNLGRLRDVKQSYIKSIRDLADAHLERISDIESEEEIPILDELPETEPGEEPPITARENMEREASVENQAGRTVVEKTEPVKLTVSNEEVNAPPVVGEISDDETGSDNKSGGAQISEPKDISSNLDMVSGVKNDGITGSNEVGDSGGGAEERTDINAGTVKKSEDTEVRTASVAPAVMDTSLNRKSEGASITVKEERLSKPPPSSKLVEEVLSLEENESIFSGFLEEENGDEPEKARRKNRKEKKEKHFFWE